MSQESSLQVLLTLSPGSNQGRTAETPVDSVDLVDHPDIHHQNLKFLYVSMVNTFPSTFGRVTKVFVSWGMVNLASHQNKGP